MKFNSPLVEILLKEIKDSSKKKLICTGIENDEPVKELAKHFKYVLSCYEFLKCRPGRKQNYCLKKEASLYAIKKFPEFDVILIMNEMHHFPDIYQLWTYKRLQKNQELIVVERGKAGSFEKIYVCFQNCNPLLGLAKKIMDQAVKQKIIKITKKRSFKEEYFFESADDLKKFFKFILPDHWPFGRACLEKKLRKKRFPLMLHESEILYHIQKNADFVEKN